MGRGISSGTMGIIVMAIMAGLVGAYVVRNSLLKEPVVAKATPPNVTIPLATTDLPSGRTIVLGDIALVSMTPEDMREQGFGGIETMMSPEQIIGRTLREPVRQGQPFLTTSLYLEGTRGDYTSQLRPGYRAYSMAIPKDRGGALPPGTMVDLFFRTTPRAAAQGVRGIPEVTLQLLQGIEIIDVYEAPIPASNRSAGLDIRNMGVRTPPPPTVTLAVTPEQAQMLQTATGRGEMALVARPDNERLAGSTNLKAKTLDDLLGLEPPPQIVVFATEAYRRGQRSVNVYRNDTLVEELSKQPTPMPPALDPNDDPLGTAPPSVPVPPVPGPVNPLPVNPVPVNPALVTPPGLPVPPAPIPAP